MVQSREDVFLGDKEKKVHIHMGRLLSSKMLCSCAGLERALVRDNLRKIMVRMITA